MASGTLAQALAAALERAAHSDAPVVTVPLARDAALLHDVLACGGLGARRALFAGEAALFLGVGTAVDAGALAPAQAAEQLAVLPSTSPRRFCVALPFTTVRGGDDGGFAPLLRSSLWAPRLFVHLEGAVGVAGVDLGDDAALRPAALVEARALLAQLEAAASSTAARLPPLSDGAPRPDEAAHAAAIAGALDAMHGGALHKVVLARRTRAALSTSPAAAAAALLPHLNSSRSDEVTWLVGDGASVALGRTPERLQSRRGVDVSVDVLAGTARVGDDALLSRDKDRREHEWVRAFVVSALGGAGAVVDAPAEPTLRRLARVQHLFTPVRATLPAARPVFHLLHPTPAVAGVPLSRALDVIAAAEGFDRGLYAGAVGVAWAGGEDLWVGLRCAHIHQPGAGSVVDLFAGGGIVLGSDAAHEWRELNDKERTMRQALQAAGALDGP